MGAGIMTEQLSSKEYQPSTPEQEREVQLAVQRIHVFERRYGGKALKLACHAAFPMALTSELVYCLRENFVPEVPWYGAADVLLSGLCQPIGHDLYEMYAAVRIQLLQSLRAVFGDERILDLEALMADYIIVQLGLEAQQAEAQGRASRERSRMLGDRPHWTTLCCLRSGEARQAIEQEVKRIWMHQDVTERERLHLSAMVENYGFLLPGEPILLNWAEQVEEAKAPSSSWDDWAAQYGITLVPKQIEVVWIRFADERVELEDELNPNLLREFQFDVVILDGRGNEAQRECRTASYFVEPLGKGVPPLELVAIPSGEFLMGSPEDEVGHLQGEEPQHRAQVQPFFMGKYPVTQAQWRFVATQLPQIQQVLIPSPSRFVGNDLPVAWVSWLEAQEFCARMSIITGRICRLPTETEWEYACRAGTVTPFHFGQTISSELANYDGNYTYGQGKKGKYRNETSTVGSFGVANGFGLYDMHGNVWEWCLDHWHMNYQGAPTDGSAWINNSDNGSRVLRGGSWSFDPCNCRSAYRRGSSAADRYFDFGFRVVYSSARTPP
jgi:formylglycine-generating enzyme required for sulfatase activity